MSTTDLANALISFEDFALNVNGKLLFEDTNWIFERGQHWAIVGANGSGKSTLVNALCHKITPARGRILYFFEKESPGASEGLPFFNQRDIVVISPEVQKEFIQQYMGYHQARWMSFEGSNAPSVTEFLSAKSIEHVSPYEVTPFKVHEEVYLARRKKALELLKIDYLLERKIIHLSTGEIRKVLLARAFMQSPKLLILDDPFCGLDAASREVLYKAIEEMLSTGTPGILLAASRMDEIPQGITHILGVAGNRVIFQGPRELIPQMPLVSQNLNSENNERDLPTLNFQSFYSEQATDANSGGQVLVEMKNVSVSYSRVQVLHDITWTVKKGERWAIFGHNGAGKTTLLSMILGDNPQVYANEVSIFGNRRGSGESIWEIKQHIGWVSPELQVHYASNLTCLEVVCSGFFDSIGLYQDCTPSQISAALLWMNLLQIEALADSLFSSLSVGEQRLILLARALVKKPPLLILDEPCQGLDFHHRKRINDLLDQLCAQTLVGLIYVTHYIDEIPKAVTRVLRLEKGRMVDNQSNYYRNQNTEV